ncbi:hypothetical protein BDP27DRAFT_1326915 [Rhodocollybia butyracea]|uniref:Uncharacterized protein n=1 Tax=Rhodocollybia butyracea TaxID=206335 RepID=A0A9P5U835_9AGAR|nr:hypothetical protein BDP27DRAFT_1326915 [Rhodocollybia butyracea]
MRRSWISLMPKYGLNMEFSVLPRSWDILIHFSDDVELLFLPGRFRPPTIAYFVSRYTFLVYFISQYFDENLNGQCAMTPTGMAVTVLGYVALVITLLQFFLRVKAIFSGNQCAIGFFAFLWLLAAGGCSFVLIGVSSGTCNPGYTIYSFYIPVTSILIHDSCIFAAISYRILSVDFSASSTLNLSDSSKPCEEEQSKLWKKIATLWGKNLPSLSKAILREGQLYYLEYPHAFPHTGYFAPGGTETSPACYNAPRFA